VVQLGLGEPDRIGVTTLASDLLSESSPGAPGRAFYSQLSGVAGETQHPAGHRDGNSVRGKFKDQRELHFGGSSRAKKAAARRRISFSCSSSRIRFLASLSSAASFSVTPGRAPSSMSAFFSQLCRVASEMPKSWRSAPAGLHASERPQRHRGGTRLGRAWAC
jgi:hypothetical protein